MNLPEILLLLLIAEYFIVLPKFFAKAGQPAWKGYIPGYNFYIWLQLTNRPWYWLILLLIPGVNLLMLIIMNVELAIVFNKRSAKDQWFVGVLPWIALPMMAFKDEEVKYVGPRDWKKIKKSTSREWGEAIIFAIIAATVIRTFLLEAFTIPSPSMEKSMLVGDYLFVSKVNYGPRSPMTPISFPLAHHTMPVLGTKSYVEWFEMPYFRLPGLGDVERNDAAVFNFPHGDTIINQPDMSTRDYYQYVRGQAFNLYRKSAKNPSAEEFMEVSEKYKAQASGMFENQYGLEVRPLDKKEHYIKRVVGLPGDTLRIVDRQITVNGEPTESPEHLQFDYFVESSNLVSTQNAIERRLDLRLKSAIGIEGNRIRATVEPREAEMIKQISGVDTVYVKNEERGEMNLGFLRIFPHHPDFDWTPDNFGPLYIPKKGSTIELSLENLPKYERVIDVYENNDLKVRGQDIFINGEKVDSYTFKQDYYWLMGDNRHQSLDSRFWGFVPFDHVVGEAVFTWFSKENSAQHNGSEVRWERMFKLVE